MKKNLVIIVSVVLALSLLSGVSAAAEETDIENAQREALGLEQLEDSLTGSAPGMLEGLEIGSDIDFNLGLSQILETGKRELGGIMKTAARRAALVLVITMLCSLCETIYENASGSAVPNYVSLAGVLAISVLAVGDAAAFIGLGRNMLDELSGFSKLLLPTLAAAAAGAGAVTSSSAKFAATSLFMDILLTVSTGILIPIIYAYIAASIGEAAVGGEAMSGASSFLKWLATTVLTLIVLAFILYIGLSGVVSSAADAVAVRLAKTTLSTTLPVVGSIMSDAASSVLAGASVLKNAIGVFGMLAVVALCLIPFLQLATHYIFYKAASKLAATVSGGRIAKLVGGISGAFGLIMGLMGASAVMLFFSLVSLIKVVA